MDENKFGKIVSVVCKDFITFNYIKFVPGDYLNIIIGPNGTGKSSIVAAIVLGLGGNCKLLSRSKDISDYVKNGKNKASIEIELRKANNKLATFHRSFDKNSKEIFLVDGTKVSYKEYLRRASEYNVQVDNLCQFLPQDRVQDFTKMNPQELLRNTQISVCSQDIMETLQKLIDKREEQKNASKSNSDNINKLKDAEERNEQLKSQIENIQMKNKLLEQYNLCTKKKAWVEYNVLYNQLKDIESDKKKMENLVQQKNKEIKPLQIEATKLNAVKDQLKRDMTISNGRIKDITSDLDKLADDTEKSENEIRRAKRNLKDIIAAASDREKDIEEAKHFLNAYKGDCADLKRQVEAEGEDAERTRSIKRQMDQLRSQNDTLFAKRNQVTKLLEEKIVPSMKSLERKIQSISNIEKQRLDKLRTLSEDAYKAYEWLQQHHHEFESHIYNPIMVEIDVLDQQNAKYLENTIASRDLLSFVCTSKQDMAKLSRIFRSDMKLSVNVAYTDPTDEILYDPNYDIEQLAQFGFHSYLLDMIEGPPSVLNYLCRLNGIHRIPVGDDRTYNISSKVPDDINLFFSTNHRFSVNISRYSGAKSCSCSEIGVRNLLNTAIDTHSLEMEKASLKRLKDEADIQRNMRNKIEYEIKENETQLQNLKMEIKKTQEKVVKLRQCQDQMRRKELELKKLMEKSYNIDEEQAKFKKRVDTIIGNLFKTQSARVTVLDNYQQAVVAKTIAQKKLQVFEHGNAEIEDQIRRAQEEVKKLSETLNKIVSSYDQVKQKCKAKQAEAKKLTDNLSPNHPDFPYTKPFEELSNDLEELKTQIDELQGRIDCIQGADSSIFEEYESRKKFIEEMKETIRNVHKNSEKIEKSIVEMHNKWYPAIKNVVDEINKNFSMFMQMMGFVGEVEIIHNDERDYQDYGIQIRVQYRNNERLQPLSRYVQSGGERAVAIAIYTMSLQHLTKVPFRCVDEINQGMDPKNERKIFGMLVDLTCKVGQSQYFFVTPKLLPGLPFHDLMTVHVVHNGKFIDSPDIFNNAMEKLQLC